MTTAGTKARACLKHGFCGCTVAAAAAAVHRFCDSTHATHTYLVHTEEHNHTHRNIRHSTCRAQLVLAASPLRNSIYHLQTYFHNYYYCNVRFTRNTAEYSKQTDVGDSINSNNQPRWSTFTTKTSKTYKSSPSYYHFDTRYFLRLGHTVIPEIYKKFGQKAQRTPRKP